METIALRNEYHTMLVRCFFPTLPIYSLQCLVVGNLVVNAMWHVTIIYVPLTVLEYCQIEAERLLALQKTQERQEHVEVSSLHFLSCLDQHRVLLIAQ